MKLYHATNADALPSILREGLKPYVDGDPVHLSAHDTSAFIYALGDFGPGGMYESENGNWDVVVLLQVDLGGLDFEAYDGPRALAFGPDNDEHYMCFETIPPERITVLSVYRED